jgi:hypothetical protein
VLSYPEGKVVGTIAQAAAGACSDELGNVYFVYGKSILVYTHGSTTASQTLTLPSDGAHCSVDPLSGNLAVALANQLDIAFFTPPYGQPTVYQLYGFVAHYCGYDNAGNLFIDGYNKGDNPGLAEVAAGSGNISYISLSLPEDSYPETLQWDGNYLAMTVQRSQKVNPHIAIDRLSISGSTATVVSSTTIKGVKHHVGASWLYDNQVTIIYSTSRGFPNIGIWSYPKGGRPVHRIINIGGKQAVLSGVAVSVAP